MYATAPAVASYVAPAGIPTTTMAAPTMYQSYAPQMQSYAPQMQSYAPQVVTTATPSYTPLPAATVAAPVAAPVVAPQMMPAPPAKLTQGIPTPDQIAHQKAAYAKALDAQLESAKKTVTQEAQIEKQMAEFNASKQIELYKLQVNEKLTETLAQIDEVATIQSLELKKAHTDRNLQLENQAQGLKMDWDMKTLMSNCARAQQAFQQQYVQAETRLAQDYQAQVARAATGTPYAATVPQTVVMR